MRVFEGSYLLSRDYVNQFEHEVKRRKPDIPSIEDEENEDVSDAIFFKDKRSNSKFRMVPQRLMRHGLALTNLVMLQMATTPPHHVRRTGRLAQPTPTSQHLIYMTSQVYFLSPAAMAL